MTPIVEEETDESTFWIDLAADAELIRRKLVVDLLQEGRELLAITVSSKKTAKSRRDAGKAPRRKKAE